MLDAAARLTGREGEGERDGGKRSVWGGGSEGRAAKLCEGDGPNSSHTFFSFCIESGDKSEEGRESKREERRERGRKVFSFNVRDRGACNNIRGYR